MEQGGSVNSRGVVSIIAVVGVTAILLFSCSPLVGDLDGTDASVATLTVSLGSVASRTIEPGTDMTMTSFDITGTGPSGASFSAEDVTGTGYTADNIVTGSWTIEVNGYNGSGTSILAGSVETEIVSGENSVTVDVYPLTDDGAFSATITWPEGEVVLSAATMVSSFTPSGGGSVGLSFSITEGGAACSDSVAPGYYVWDFQIREHDHLRYRMPPEVVRIISFEETSHSIALAADDLIPLPQADTPDIIPGNGTYAEPQLITLTCATADSFIMYTTDGSVPSRTNGTEYLGAPFTVGSTTTVRAAAFHPDPGWYGSDVTAATIEITGTCATPVFTPSPGPYPDPISLDITSTTPGALIMYTTDGTTVPTESTGALLTAPIGLTSDETTVMAVAVADVNGDATNEVSDLITGVFTITGYLEAPTADVSTGTYSLIQNVNLHSSDPAATIYYSLDGTTPDEATGLVFETGTPIVVDRTGRLQAIALRDGWVDSPPLIVDYTMKCADPMTDSDASVIIDGEAAVVSFSSDSPGVEYFYTLDGSPPTASAGTSGTSAAVSGGTTLNVIATRDGWIDSEITSVDYVAFSDTVSTPVNGEAVIDTTPQIDWADITGAAGYQLEVNTADTFDETDVIDDGDLVDSVYPVTTPLADSTTYYWRIRRKDSLGNWGDWSVARSFTVEVPAPSNPNPANAETTIDPSPLLDWEDIPGASGYHISIQTADSLTVVQDDDTLTESCYKATALPADKDEFLWSVRTRNEDGVWGDWSQSWVLNTASNINITRGGSAVGDGTGFYDFGDTVADGDGNNASAYVDFTIESTGSTNLAVSDISLSAGDTEHFDISVGDTASPIAPGDSTTFAVRFDPLDGGDKSATVSVLSSYTAGTEAPQYYTFEVKGTSAPEIVVKQGTTELVSGSSVHDFGPVSVDGSGGATSGPVTFTIENIGTAALEIASATKPHGVYLSSSADDLFVLDESGTQTQVPPGGTTTFTITYDPVWRGIASALATIESNDPVEDVYTFTITGVSQEPHLVVYQGDTYMPNYSGIFDFGAVGNDGDGGESSSYVEFTLRNEGSDDLYINNIYFYGGSPHFDLDDTSVSPIPGGGSTTFSVRYDPIGDGSHTEAVRIATPEYEHHLYVTGESYREIDVTVGSTEIPNESTYEFGIALSDGDGGEAGDTVVFTIENSGVSDLNISSVELSSGDTGDFDLVPPAETTVSPTGSTTFSVTFDPVVAGSKSAILTIVSDDADEGAYTIDLQGIGSDSVNSFSYGFEDQDLSLFVYGDAVSVNSDPQYVSEGDYSARVSCRMPDHSYSGASFTKALSPQPTSFVELKFAMYLESISSAFASTSIRYRTGSGNYSHYPNIWSPTQAYRFLSSGSYTQFTHNLPLGTWTEITLRVDNNVVTFLENDNQVYQYTATTTDVSEIVDFCITAGAVSSSFNIVYYLDDITCTWD